MVWGLVAGIGIWGLDTAGQVVRKGIEVQTSQARNRVPSPLHLQLSDTRSWGLYHTDHTSVVSQLQPG